MLGTIPFSRSIDAQQLIETTRNAQIDPSRTTRNQLQFCLRTLLKFNMFAPEELPRSQEDIEDCLPGALYFFNFYLENKSSCWKKIHQLESPPWSSGPTNIVWKTSYVFQGPAKKNSEKFSGWWSDWFPESGWLHRLHHRGLLVQDSLACRTVEPPTTIIAGLGQPGGIRVLRFRSLKWKVVTWCLLGGWGCYDEKIVFLSRES